MSALIPVLIGAVVTIGIFVSTVVFRGGHQAARIEELERWRGAVRQDLHEVSDALEAVRLELKRLSTIIEERAQRFRSDRS